MSNSTCNLLKLNYPNVIKERIRYPSLTYLNSTAVKKAALGELSNEFAVSVSNTRSEYHYKKTIVDYPHQLIKNNDGIIYSPLINKADKISALGFFQNNTVNRNIDIAFFLHNKLYHSPITIKPEMHEEEKINSCIKSLKLHFNDLPGAEVQFTLISRNEQEIKLPWCNEKYIQTALFLNITVVKTQQTFGLTIITGPLCLQRLFGHIFKYRLVDKDNFSIEHATNILRLIAADFYNFELSEDQKVIGLPDLKIMADALTCPLLIYTYLNILAVLELRDYYYRSSSVSPNSIEEIVIAAEFLKCFVELNQLVQQQRFKPKVFINVNDQAFLCAAGTLYGRHQIRKLKFIEENGVVAQPIDSQKDTPIMKETLTIAANKRRNLTTLHYYDNINELGLPKQFFSFQRVLDLVESGLDFKILNSMDIKVPMTIALVCPEDATEVQTNGKPNYFVTHKEAIIFKTSDLETIISTNKVPEIAVCSKTNNKDLFASISEAFDLSKNTQPSGAKGVTNIYHVLNHLVETNVQIIKTATGLMALAQLYPGSPVMLGVKFEISTYVKVDASPTLML